MRFSPLSTIVLGTCVLSACLSADEAPSEDEATEQPTLDSNASALRPVDPCALVRCRAGTSCEVVRGRPVCIPDPEVECKQDADCRLFSNYCDGCACDALSVNETDPVCKGNIVACFVDPCMNHQAYCDNGQCVTSAASF